MRFHPTHDAGESVFNMIFEFRFEILRSLIWMLLETH